MHHIRKPLSRFVHCWAQGGTCGRTIWTFHGGGSDHKGNEVKHKWTVSNFRYLGKRTRSLFQQQRRGLPGSSGRTCPRGATKRCYSWTSEGGADGAKLEQSLETDGLWRGDSWTVNISEWPSAESVSLLSSTLEVNAPEKYYLSARACQGILTRASRRGKKLPDLLQTALLEMIEWWKRGGAEHSLYLENTFGMRGRRQGRAGTNGENRDAIDAPRPNALPTDPGTDILHQRKYS